MATAMCCVYLAIVDHVPGIRFYQNAWVLALLIALALSHLNCWRVSARKGAPDLYVKQRYWVLVLVY